MASRAGHDVAMSEVLPSRSSEQQTFLFADLAGFTAMTEVHGDDHAADVVDVFGRATRDLLPAYGAEQIKAIGDAVRLAVRLVDEVGAQHGFPAVRVGVHTGPAVRRGDDWFGATVNLAARVTDAARGGEILATEATREAMRAGASGTELRSVGDRRFKNVSEPVAVYAVVRQGEQTDAGMPVDPVCRMALRRELTEHHVVHRGVEYHFCSAECRERFTTDPRRYARRGGAPRGELLVSDDARERAARVVQRAYRRGRLDQEELEERVERAYSARTRDELTVVTRGLPVPWRVRRRRAWKAFWRTIIRALRRGPRRR